MKIARQVAAVAMSVAGFAIAAAPAIVLAQTKSPVPMVLISQANEAGFPIWLAKKLDYFADDGIDARSSTSRTAARRWPPAPPATGRAAGSGSPPAITGWAKFGLIPVGTMMKEDRNIKLIMRKDALKGSSPKDVLMSKPIGSVPNSTWSQVLFACAKHFGRSRAR